MNEAYAAQRANCIFRNITHGLSGHQYYPKWRDMMNRCYSQNNEHYRDYGGRGIVVCEEWRKDVGKFLAWADIQEPIPTGYSLDRFPDLNGPYSPTNCRFASPSQQNRNMRSNVLVEYNGEKLIFKDFVEKYGVVSYETAKSRVLHHGWNRIESALTPLYKRKVK